MPSRLQETFTPLFGLLMAAAFIPGEDRPFRAGDWGGGAGKQEGHGLPQ
jgi:hypothetical protein